MKKKPSLPVTSLDRYDWSRARRGHWAGTLRTAKAVLDPPRGLRALGSDAAIRSSLRSRSTTPFPRSAADAPRPWWGALRRRQGAASTLVSASMRSV